MYVGITFILISSKDTRVYSVGWKEKDNKQEGEKKEENEKNLLIFIIALKKFNWYYGKV